MGSLRGEKIEINNSCPAVGMLGEDLDDCLNVDVIY